MSLTTVEWPNGMKFLQSDRLLGVTTFMNDPQLAGVSPEDGQRLFDDMLFNQKAYLPAEWFD